MNDVILVPTMGALHQGHSELIKTAVRRAKLINAKVIVSVFVNPLQFSPNEDYQRYPRNLDNDQLVAKSAGADEVFAPSVDEIYGQNFSSIINVGEIANCWEGKTRQGHFNGVATVVLKLCNLVKATEIFLGEKDYQQLCVIKKVFNDLNVNVAVSSAPTVRDELGLALSSRNAYLSPENLSKASELYRQLAIAVKRFQQNDSLDDIVASAVKSLQENNFSRIDYFAPVDQYCHHQLTNFEPKGRFIAAAYLDGVRLIDNLPIGS